MRKFYKNTITSNSSKKDDDKARKRNVNITFRVSPEEKKLIEKRIEISGLSKSSFFIQSCLYQSILVKGNIKSFDAIKKNLDKVAEQVDTSFDLTEMDVESLEAFKMILEIFTNLYGRK